MKKIAVGDLGEFWYGDYKEPFEQLEGGVPGHPVGVLLKDDEGKVLCAYCGRVFDNLGHHVREKHGMSSHDYKAEVGLLQKSSLTSERLRVQKIAHAKRMVMKRGRAYMTTLLREGHTANRTYGPNQSARSPERLNKTGRCYSQLLAVGRTILQQDGRITQATLRRRGISERSVLAFWDDLDAFRRSVGDPFRNQNRVWTDAQLVAALHLLAMKLGRTPAESDLKRHGLPWASTYINHFGSWSAACQRAGLDANLPIALTKETELRFLVAYATIGRCKDAAKIAGIGQNRGQEIMRRYGAPFAEMATVGGRRAGKDTSVRRAWAAEMARRLAGETEPAAA